MKARIIPISAIFTCKRPLGEAGVGSASLMTLMLQRYTAFRQY
jgi:hypothetical protein